MRFYCPGHRQEFDSTYDYNGRLCPCQAVIVPVRSKDITAKWKRQSPNFQPPEPVQKRRSSKPRPQQQRREPPPQVQIPHSSSTCVGILIAQLKRELAQ